MVVCFRAASQPPARDSAPPPNIVFILADDLGWGDVAFNGGSVPTPHLDRLAREGLQLKQHYVAPVCTPTRAGVLTGRLWSRFGVFSVVQSRCLPWETETLPRALKRVGYDSALIGKWHLGSQRDWGPQHYGFDHSYGSFAGGVGPYSHRYKRGNYSETWHRNGNLVEEEGHVTDLLAAEAVSWIESRGKAPFFLYLPMTAVHLPIKEPAQWLEKVPGQITGELKRQYAACTMHLDDTVGRVVAALERAGKRDNTLIVFSSDNGGTSENNNDKSYPGGDYVEGPMPGRNHPWRAGKGTVYEGGTRVPTIASWPGQLKAGVVNEPLQITDWMPTFCALAGYRPTQELKWDGMNVWPVLSGKVRHLPSRALYTPFARASALREGDWKLIVFAEGGKVELFNIADDPTEKNDLAAKMPERVETLRRRLAELAKADRDSVVAK